METGTSLMKLDCHSLEIATNAVHDDSDRSVRDTVYVGLYTGIGMSLLIDVVLSLLMWAVQED